MNVDPHSASWKALKKHFEQRIEKLRLILEAKDDPEARGAIKEIRRTIAKVEGDPSKEIVSDAGPIYT